MKQAQDLRAVLRPVRSPPYLIQTPIFGVTMCGAYSDADLRDAYYSAYYSMCCLTIFYVPVLPFRIFLISQPENQKFLDDPKYTFHAKVRMLDFARTYPGAFRMLLNSAMGEGLKKLFFIAGFFALLALSLEGIALIARRLF